MTDSVLLSRDARGIATITLNRPDKRNAFDDELIRKLHSIIEGVAADKTIRAVVLTGAGSMFTAGADLVHMRKQGTMSEQENVEDALRFAQCLRALDTLDKPVIARVNGGAYGGGVGIIACADIAIGVSTAKFALTEVKFGIVPAVISPYVVAAIGRRHSRRWFLTAMTLEAAIAKEIGLLHEVVEPAELDTAVGKCLALLLKGGPIAQGEAKTLVNTVHEMDARESPGYTARLLARLRGAAEGKEGLTAYLENRKSYWDTEP
jgi:methylglutaconyl-CoA hydratase